MKRIVMCLLLAGCVATPKTINECDGLFTIETEIEECKERVIKREDKRAKRKEKERLEKAKAEACWRRRGVYDKRNGRCRSFDDLR